MITKAFAATLLFGVLALGAVGSAGAQREGKEYLFSNAAYEEDLPQTDIDSPPAGDSAPPPCAAERWVDAYVISSDGEGNLNYGGDEWIEDCATTCTYRRIDDIDGGDPAWSEFTTIVPWVIGYEGPIWALVDSDSFSGLTNLIWYCRDGAGAMIDPAGMDIDNPAEGDLRLAFPHPTYGATLTPWYLPIPVTPTIVDIDGVLARLWAGIPTPDMQVGAAPPLHRDHTYYQAPNWVWLEEIEEPLFARSWNSATTAVLVRAKLSSVRWDFGDGSDPITCTPEQMVEWTPDYHLVHDADQGCTYTYRSQVDGPLALRVEVTFEGEQALVTRPGSSFAWPEPDWQPYIETRVIDLAPIEVIVSPLLSLNVNEEQIPTS